MHPFVYILISLRIVCPIFRNANIIFFLMFTLLFVIANIFSLISINTNIGNMITIYTKITIPIAPIVAIYFCRLATSLTFATLAASICLILNSDYLHFLSCRLPRLRRRYSHHHCSFRQTFYQILITLISLMVTVNTSRHSHQNQSCRREHHLRHNSTAPKIGFQHLFVPADNI